MNCSDTASYVTAADLIVAKASVAQPFGVDCFWLIINAEIVFLMQLGFMLLEVGSVRAQHAKAICVKNVVDFLLVRFSSEPPLNHLYAQSMHTAQYLHLVGALT